MGTCMFCNNHAYYKVCTKHLALLQAHTKQRKALRNKARTESNIKSINQRTANIAKHIEDK